VTVTLEGRAAIVTGGARGIGRAVCERLAEAGYAVVINCQSSVDAAQQVAAGIRDGGGRAIVVSGSIADPATGPSLVQAAMDEFGRLDVLVNNAGITRDVTMRRMTDEQFTEVLETNLTGTHRVTRAAIEPMCEAGYGRIVTVSSFVGEIGNFGQANYAASKGGLIAWTKALALELARFGVTANCVCPGFIDTDMLRQVPERVAENLLARIPLGRFGTPDDVARGVLFLARDGDYVTGTCLDINGGLRL
jgi:acetoacetyl-CoA reductase